MMNQLNKGKQPNARKKEKRAFFKNVGRKSAWAIPIKYLG
jgi:hypothetical protein